jgi:hypothetical protein
VVRGMAGNAAAGAVIGAATDTAPAEADPVPLQNHLAWAPGHREESRAPYLLETQ